MNFVRLYTRVLEMLGDESRLAWTLGIANLSLAAAQFAEPILFGRIVDALSGAQNRNVAPAWTDVVTLLGAWVAFGLFAIVCGALVALHADRLSHRQRHVVMSRYFEHILQLPMSFHGTIHSGRMLKIMLSGTDAMWWLWLGFFREHLAAFVSLVILLPLSLFLNWRLALLLILLCIVFAALTVLVVRRAEEGQSAAERHYGELAERASDTLGNVALVQSFARVELEVSGIKDIVNRLLSAQLPVLSWWAIGAVLTRASTTLTVLSIFVVGIWLNIHGLTTVGEIVTFTSFAGLVINRLEFAVSFANRLVQDAPRLKEFFEVADTVPAVRDRPDAVDPGRVRGLVEFSDVSFSYDGKRPAVSDLGFTALPGEIIALVGPTGAGKTTALALLHRVFDPQSGTIKLDGMDIRGLKLEGLRRNIGVVFQEVLLFNRSIAENLRVGKPDATDEEIRVAAERAQALEFIRSHAQGFEAPVGERGRMLSGGERQRLSIARALLKNPPILILDEATSALDATTEVKVWTALDELMRDRTTFVIAHRLSTVRNATRILVFEHGRVVESGTYDELLRRGGAFTELARAQFLIADDTGAAPAADAAAPVAAEDAAQ
ncbi:glucan ABC transporter ATP-binding protein/ permease [Rhodoplanes sp. Z2-YC6860]|uniref:glucan ABC transporter ATP-binding protein/ permease n=1 Tax=Rhodoplanes sp. Z2-YC6860 TaxID=674703 RepID=UPI00078CE1AC|nr:glucan ABC transporter ATP-binding protein/ permease [Rhodoplanes sp. Z2-YC6860]AMN44523.1 glucan exporter ATP-binding protein [Rhodoplanes sp. Z2-YC6860]